MPSAKPYHLEIRFFADLISDIWNSRILWHWLYIWHLGRLLKIWKSEKSHPSYLCSVSWNSDILVSISLLTFQVLQEFSFHLMPDRWFSNLLRMLFCLYPEYISVCFLPDGQCSAGILFWGSQLWWLLCSRLVRRHKESGYLLHPRFFNLFRIASQHLGLSLSPTWIVRTFLSSVLIPKITYAASLRITPFPERNSGSHW